MEKGQCQTITLQLNSVETEFHITYKGIKNQPKCKEQKLEKQSLEFPFRQNDEGDTNLDILLASPKGPEVLSHLTELQTLEAQLRMR